MDELEFRKRVYSDPNNLDQETLDAASVNPELQRILDQTRKIEASFDELAQNTRPAPEQLRTRLLAIPARELEAAGSPRADTVKPRTTTQPWYRHFALAASLVLAVGATASFFIERGPDASELAFGNQIITHVYHEVSEIDAINAGTLLTSFTTPTVNEVMANSGSQLRNADFLQQMPVRYAKPCFIASPFNSSHLILQSNDGAINVIAVDNEPVSQEFLISDERFSGIVVPLSRGNLIIIGEKNQNLDDYRNLFSDNLEWEI